MAQSPRPPGAVRALGPQGLHSLGTKGLERVAGRIAGGRPQVPGRRASSVGPQTSLGRDGRPEEPVMPARACMTQHDLAQAPTQAQRKPRLGGARGRSRAQMGARLLISPLPLLSSPFFPVSTS